MSDNRILDIISSPADLKLLSNEELSILASEIRQEIASVETDIGNGFVMNDYVMEKEA